VGGLDGSWGDRLGECGVDSVGSGLGSLAGFCEYCDEHSGSGASDLVNDVLTWCFNMAATSRNPRQISGTYTHCFICGFEPSPRCLWLKSATDQNCRRSLTISKEPEVREGRGNAARLSIRSRNLNACEFLCSNAYIQKRWLLFLISVV
jgi:hypothetical protein